MNYFLLFVFLFFIGSCIGWVIELFFRRLKNPMHKWVNPGFLVGPYLPLYGFGLWGMYNISYFVGILSLDNKILNTVMVFIVMSLCMTIIEYIAGIIFIKGMKLKLWDYSDEKLNIQGIICVRFSLLWGILGTLYYFIINTRVEGWVFWLSEHLTFSFFVGVFFGIFAVDMGYTLQLSTKIRQFAIDNDLVIKYEELKERIQEQREELEERSRFVLAFKTEKHFREHMEMYVERTLESRRRKRAEAEEALKRLKTDIRVDIDEVREDIMEDISDIKEDIRDKRTKQ